MSEAAIGLDHVVLARPGEFRLEADFEVPAGERVALMGASGSGKSTLLDLIAGFETPDRGRVYLGGRDVTDNPPAGRPVTMLFQQDNLFGHLDAFTNVALGRSPSLKLSQQDRAAVASALARVGLAGKEKRLPSELSGGERQRVAIARVLVRDRPVLLLDEPFASLGPALSGEMLRLVAEIATERSMAVILVTHEPREAADFSNRTLFLDAGRIVADGTTESVLGEGAVEAVRRYLGG